MKLQRTILAALLIVAAIVPAAMTAKNVKLPKVYMFGFAASFNDTIVHFTEIQAIDSAWIDSKTKFLLGRESYSMQLRQYLESQNMPGRTCVVFYDRKLNKLQKQYLKMKKLYSNTEKVKNRNDVRTLATGDFRFVTVNRSETVAEQQAPSSKNSKSSKKKEKQKKSEGEK